MEARIKTYLDKIAANKPIDLGKFRDFIAALNLEAGYLTQEITGIKVKGSMYRITHFPIALEQALQRVAEADHSTRVGKSQINRSHDVPVSGSMLIVRPAKTHNAAQIAHPQVVTFDANGTADFKFPSARRAIIVENLENFLAYEQAATFLATHCAYALADSDVIFGNGNQISNPKHRNFLQQYDEIALWLDFDFGGFKIANNIAQLVSDKPLEFILPDDIEQRLERVTQRIPLTHLHSILEIANKHAFLRTAGKLMARFNRPLEQESYLHG